MTTTIDRLPQIEQIRTRFRALREEVIETLLAGPLDYAECQSLHLLQDDACWFAEELERGFIDTQLYVENPDGPDRDATRERMQAVTPSLRDPLILRGERYPLPVFVQAEELGLPTA